MSAFQTMIKRLVNNYRNLKHLFYNRLKTLFSQYLLRSHPVGIMEKYFLIPKQFVKIVRCICTRKSEVLTGMSDFITQDAFQKWLPVIFHLLALWTSFCGTKSVVYSCVRRMCMEMPL